MNNLVHTTLPPPYSGNVPSSKEEEDRDLQRALEESMNPTPSRLTPQPPSLPPQESGVTETVSQTQYFGPANRLDYETGEWAMVHLKNVNPDPEPSRRMRKPGVPAFLRCRAHDWGRHRMGALLTILHAIPKARNVFLGLGLPPEQGYGHHNDWWKGETILSPEFMERQAAGEMRDWADKTPTWPDELHRLIAFLDMTDRSYGTADVLVEAKVLGVVYESDKEVEFFENLQSCAGKTDNPDLVAPLLCRAEIVPLKGTEVAFTRVWGLLTLDWPGDMLRSVGTLNDILDAMFLADIGLSEEQFEAARMASLSHAGDVLTMRFNGKDGFPHMIDVPETFYMDRYLEVNRGQMREVQIDMHRVNRAIQESFRLEQELTMWLSERTDEVKYRRDVNTLLVEQNMHHISQIKTSAAWRQHEEALAQGKDTHYLLDTPNEVELSAEELRAVQELEANIQQLDFDSAEILRIMDGGSFPDAPRESCARLIHMTEVIKPERLELEAMFQYLTSLYTAPSQDETWNPTHAYHLCGLVNEPHTTFVRIFPEPDLMDMEPEGSARPADRWWKLQYAEGDEDPVHVEVSTTAEASCLTCRPVASHSNQNADGER